MRLDTHGDDINADHQGESSGASLHGGSPTVGARRRVADLDGVGGVEQAVDTRAAAGARAESIIVGTTRQETTVRLTP